MKRSVSAFARLMGQAKQPERRPRGEAELAAMRAQVANVPRYVPGFVDVPGWRMHYVDAPAMLSSFDVAVVKGWNDFTSTNPAPRILDCGANIGVTVLHYKHLFPAACITAFEPDREICEMLRRNVAENRLSDVEVVERAVWNAAGPHVFLSEGADGSRLVPDDRIRAGGENYSVETVRLADYLREPVDFVKLDIEGAESEVLLDCADSLKNVNSLCIECHLMNDHPQTLATTLTVLADAGFAVSANSYGDWVDLVKRPNVAARHPLAFDQYLLVCAWRPDAAGGDDARST